MPASYDAILLVSFGGPNQPDDVLPFLENVLRGKNVPHERMLEVAEHYHHFGGVSPINEQNRGLIAALQAELAAAGLSLPIYWGNRNWHPLLTDTLREMRDAGIRRALAIFTSAYSSYSGCRQYRENIAEARAAVGPDAPEVDKVRAFFNHPGFVDASVERLQQALATIPLERRPETLLVFTAHSIPMAMSANCRYVVQLEDVARVCSERVQHPHYRLVYQSRSGPPTQPWLEPDVLDFLRQVQHEGRFRDVVIAPIGFISDHMEVLYDLDTEAHHLCQDLGLNMVRAATVGTHPRFVQGLRELIVERMTDGERLSVGQLGPNPDVCPVDCCLSGRPPQGRPPASQASSGR